MKIWLRNRTPKLGDRLSPRERDVARLIADGLSNKLIADRLGISAHTAKFHVDRTCKKLGAGNRAHAAAIWARREMTIIPAAGPSGDSRTLLA